MAEITGNQKNSQYRDHHIGEANATRLAGGAGHVQALKLKVRAAWVAVTNHLLNLVAGGPTNLRRVDLHERPQYPVQHGPYDRSQQHDRRRDANCRQLKCCVEFGFHYCASPMVSK